MVGILGPSLVPEPIGEGVSDCYPQVRLKLTEEEKEHQIGVVWLENPFLRVAVSTSLGGRILAIHDLRTGTDILDFPAKIRVVSGGIRGVWGEFGVEFLAGRDRRNALGPVDHRIKDAGSPDDAVAVFLHEWDGDVSWHGVVTLPPDRAAIILEQKVHNRSWLSKEARGGLHLSGMSEQGFWTNLRETGGLQLIDNEQFLGFRDEGSFATLPPDGQLGGRRVDQWRVELIPFSGLADHRCSSTTVSVGQAGSSLKIQAHQEIKGGKVFLSVDGQTFEAPLDLEAGATNSTELGELAGRIEGIVVRNAKREVVASWPTGGALCKATPFDFPHELFDQLVVSDKYSAHDFKRMPGLEAFGWEKEATKAIANQEWEKADEAMEKYLAYHAEDGLAWWFKASIKREAGMERSDEDRELPNAHYLIPLEPVLKAEAFLNTPIAQGAEPNPLLASIAADPGVAVGVVALYYEKGLWQGMARLADELLRHKPNAMIHYLVGAALLKNSKMETTAAEHVALAERLSIEPPFPHRSVEIEAVAILAERFPDSKRVQAVWQLIEQARSADLLEGSPLQA